MSRAVPVRLRDGGQAALERALADPALRALELDLDGFTELDALVLWLARLPWSDLERLSLTGGTYGNHAALAVGMAGLPLTLRSMAIRGCGLGAPGLTHFAPALPPALEELDLSGNALGDEGAAALLRVKGLAKLRRVDLSGNGIGAASADALRARFGDRLSL